MVNNTNGYKTFDEWIGLIRRGADVYPTCKIPYQEWFEEYINGIEDKSEKDVKWLLRHILSPYTSEKDISDYKIMSTSSDTWMNIEKYKRIENSQEAWEGLTWILQFLPYSPYKAIKSLNFYLESECMYMPDDRIIGIEQSIEIIEAKFKYTNKGLENNILNLNSREFELLIQILYDHMGYQTVLTPATRDGGKDIIAKIKREDGEETVYVECKLYNTTELIKKDVGYFAYNVINDKINRGTLFCTGYVNYKIKSFDPRIKIWTLEEIIVLLNAYIGSDWKKRLNLLIENKKRENELIKQ